MDLDFRRGSTVQRWICRGGGSTSRTAGWPPLNGKKQTGGYGWLNDSQKFCSWRETFTDGHFSHWSYTADLYCYSVLQPAWCTNAQKLLILFVRLPGHHAERIRKPLLQLHLTRSKLDYGCIFYGSARQSYLWMLDPVQNHALRLCLGAYWTSPSSSLCVFANEPPLRFRPV